MKRKLLPYYLYFLFAGGFCFLCKRFQVTAQLKQLRHKPKPQHKQRVFPTQKVQTEKATESETQTVKIS